MTQKATHCACGRALGGWGPGQPEGLWRKGAHDQCLTCYRRDLRNGKVLREPTDWSRARCKHCHQRIRETDTRAADAPGTVPCHSVDCCAACHANGGTTLERAAAREEASRRKRAAQQAKAERAAERARVRTEREAARAERARLRAERDAERERIRAEQDAERAQRDAARAAARADREAARATEPTQEPAPEPAHIVTDPALARYLAARDARLHKRTRRKTSRTSI
jgi:hypothetical protein